MPGKEVAPRSTAWRLPGIGWVIVGMFLIIAGAAFGMAPILTCPAGGDRPSAEGGITDDARLALWQVRHKLACVCDGTYRVTPMKWARWKWEHRK